MTSSQPLPQPISIRSSRDVAALIDHAILHPTVTPAAVADEVRRMAGLRLASLCVRPSDVALVHKLVSEHKQPVPVCTVIGFPHGTTSTAGKVAEAKQALAEGATELDMVVHVGAALGGAWSQVHDDIAAVLAVAHAQRALLKVIFETDYLTDDAVKIRLCEICSEVGVDFVKTSTGFGYVKQADGSMNYRGATEHDVQLMRAHTPAHVGIKPSGGIRTLDAVLRFVALGATRIGTASTSAILAEAQQRFGDTSTTSAKDTPSRSAHEY